MQLFNFVLLLAPVLALAEPIDKALLRRESSLEQRATPCRVNTDKVNMRKCPATCCASYGQFAINSNVQVDCWENGEIINGYE